MTSRIIVKGIPKHFDDSRLRKHFSEAGSITDVKVMRTKEGRSRLFGFVGYQSEEEAKHAVNHFNRSFIQTSRISVDFARKVGDEHIPRPWSKYSAGSSRNHKDLNKDAVNDPNNHPQSENGTQKMDATQVGKELEILKAMKARNDPELAAFEAAMRSRRSGKVWANDDTVLEAAVEASNMPAAPLMRTKACGKHIKFDDVTAEAPGVSNGQSDQESDDEYQEMPRVGIEDDEASADRSKKAFDESVGDAEYLQSKMAEWVSSDEEDDEDSMIGEDESSHVEKQAPQKTKGDNDAQSDLPKSNSSKFSEPGSEDDEKESQEADGIADGTSTEAKLRKLRAKEILETGRLFIRNLPYSLTEESLLAEFSKFGEVSELHICKDRRTKKPTGLAFVTYLIPECAVTCYKQLDGNIVCGRLAQILPAKASPQSEKLKDDESLSYKERKDREQKRKAESSHNWNSLFMKSDTVAEAVAARLGVSKGELLSSDMQGSMAVRMALGETDVVLETKRQLSEQGVNVPLLETSDKKCSRSKTAILFKNVPYDTDNNEIRRLFAKHGDIARVVLPSTNAFAIIEMTDSNEAKAAFRAIAYSKFHDAPAFLEWAPEDIFEKPISSDPGSARDAVKDSLVSGDAPTVARAGAGGIGCVLYVKNISFDSDDSSLKQHFSSAGTVCSATVARYTGGKKDGLSKGFGFVELSSPQEAKVALKTLNGSQLQGHILQIKLSERQSATSGAEVGEVSGHRAASSGLKSGSDATSGNDEQTKVVVRNVPFEGTKKELRALFKPFGEIRSIRIPRKFDGTHRGFAFVDFVTNAEAKHALKSLQHTHFYGRHLVMEFAKDDDSLEALRVKTARYFDQLQDDSAGANNRRKRTKIEEELKESAEAKEAEEDV